MFGGGAEHSCLKEDRQLGAYSALSLSLPTAQDKGSPSDLTVTKCLTPGEGGELLPCSLCSGLCPWALLPQLSSRGITAPLLPLLVFYPEEDTSCWESGEAGRGENGCPVAGLGCQGCVTNGVNGCGRDEGSVVPFSKQRDWRATRNTSMSLPVALGEMLLCRAENPGGQRVLVLPCSGCWGWGAAPQCPFCSGAAL